MKHIFRKNQVIITALAIMIVVAGYLQFNQDKVANFGQNDAVETVTKDGVVNDESKDLLKEDAKGKTVSVSDTGEIENEEDKDKDKDNKDSKETAGEAVLVNNSINSDFFAAAKLDREQTRAKNRDLLMELVNDANLSDEQKEDAINSVIKLTTIAEMETSTEILLKAKGFSEVVVSIVQERVNVVVSADKLTDQQRAQIEDIVKNETKADVKNIVIAPVKVTKKD